MDIKGEIRGAVESGKVLLGKNTTLKAIKSKEAKLIILSENCPAKDEIVKASKANDIPLYQFKGEAFEVGSACGKPFGVSTLAILNPGETSILQLSKRR
jgi:large subunit ribosomal protein L30e